MARALAAAASLPAEVDEGGEASAPLRSVQVVFSIDLHPSRTLQLREAVADELNARLMRCAAQQAPWQCLALLRPPLRLTVCLLPALAQI